MTKQLQTLQKKLAEYGSTASVSELHMLPHPYRTMKALATAMVYYRDQLYKDWCAKASDQLQAADRNRSEAVFREVLYIITGSLTPSGIFNSTSHLKRLNLIEVLELTGSRFD